MSASLLPPLALLSAALVGGAQVTVDEIPRNFVCHWGVDAPRLPTAGMSRAEIYDLLLGQVLRRPDRQRIEAMLRERYPGAATDAFIAITNAAPSDSPKSMRTFARIASAYSAADDPDLQLEAARARFMLIEAWSSRHVGEGQDGRYLNVYETYRRTAAGRKWSALLDQFLRSYRGRGEDYDEFVAEAEYSALAREAADLTPGERFLDDRLLRPDVAEIGAALRERLKPLVARYERSPNERVQRVVAEAIDMQARYDLGREALIPIDREIIRRFAKARDHSLRATVNGSFERLTMSLQELRRDRELAAVTREQAAWAAEAPGPDCTS